MKYLIILVLSPFLLLAQPANTDKLFETGVALFQQEKVDSAILCWETLLKRIPETDPQYGRAMLNLGVAYSAIDNFREAKNWYKGMLILDLNDLSPGFEPGERYASFKHTACMRLATEEGYDGHYQEALRYVQLASNQYTYKTENGTDFERREVVLAKWKASFYQKLNHPDSALYVLLQKCLDTEIAWRLPQMTTFAPDNFYEPILPMTVQLVNSLVGKDKFVKKLERAIAGIKTEQEGLVTFGVFQLDGFTYRLGSLNPRADKDFFIEQVKSSDLYYLLSQ